MKIIHIPLFSRFISLESQLGYNIKKSKIKKQKVIIDYSVEFDNDHYKVCNKLIENINKYPNNTVAVKLSGLGLNTFNEDITDNYCNKIIKEGIKNNVKILIDAENSNLHKSIHNISDNLLTKYNTDKTHVYKTYQMYRRDSYIHLISDIDMYKINKKKLGIKLVRGAYYKQEKRDGHLYNSIIDTHNNYNNSIEMLFFKNYHNDINIKDVIFATHNKNSINLVKKNMKMHNIHNNSNISTSDINFASLMGMSEKLSHNLSYDEKYTVYKYIPFGPITKTLPYLSRRLYENYNILKYINN